MNLAMHPGICDRQSLLGSASGPALSTLGNCQDVHSSGLGQALMLYIATYIPSINKFEFANTFLKDAP